MKPDQPEGRVARRQRKNLDALLAAGREVMSKKGIDAATMQEIAEHADVGAGTIYNYFKSKDELAVAVLEQLMQNMGVRIEKVTNTFSDPAQVYAFGVRMVIQTAIEDFRWKQLLNRSEIIADAMYRCFGPFAIRDLRLATEAGRYFVPDPELNWRMAVDAIVGVSLAITQNKIPPSSIDETVVRLLCMTGIGVDEAKDLAQRPCPALEPEPFK